MNTVELSSKADRAVCIRRGYGCLLSRDLRQSAEEIDRLRDALRGLVDWCEEKSPDGGRYALLEAKEALANIRAV